MSKTIHQTTLAALLRKKQQAEELNREIEAAESEILAALKDGATVQRGTVTATIKTFERKNVAWKQKFIDFVDDVRGAGEGEKSAKRVHDSTQPTAYESLKISLVG